MNHQTFLAQKKRWQKPVEIGWEKRVWGKGGVGEVGGGGGSWGSSTLSIIKIILTAIPRYLSSLLH